MKEILTAPLNNHKTRIPSSLIVLVGPEGGWSEEEEQNILNHHYEAISLGKQVLRTETAALSCVAIMSHFWNF